MTKNPQDVNTVEISEEADGRVTVKGELGADGFKRQSETDNVSITLIRRAKGVEISVVGSAEEALNEYYALCETFGGDPHQGYDVAKAPKAQSRSEQIAQHVARRYRTRR